MRSGTPDELDATLRQFLAVRAADTARMPTEADVTARITADPHPAAYGRAMRPAWVLLILLALGRPRAMRSADRLSPWRAVFV